MGAYCSDAESLGGEPQRVPPPTLRLPELTSYLEQLGEHGYAVVPPEVTGVSASMIDELVRRLLDKSEELIGCRFSVADGPERPL